MSWCRGCLNESSRRWNRSEGGPRYRRYGVRRSEVYGMWLMQGGRCPACGDIIFVGGAHVDHDHATNEVRGLMCGPCNQGLGNFKDDPARLRGAARYLEVYG